MNKIISALLFIYNSKVGNNEDFYSNKKITQKRFRENRCVITIKFYMMS